MSYCKRKNVSFSPYLKVLEKTSQIRARDCNGGYEFWGSKLLDNDAGGGNGEGNIDAAAAIPTDGLFVNMFANNMVIFISRP